MEGSVLKVPWNIIKKLFNLFCMIFTPLKRLWCRRKRRNSDTVLPMTMPTHYPSVENLSPNGVAQEDLTPWDAWDDQAGKIRSVEQYRYYQQQALQRQNSVEPEEEPDYFQEMAPSLKRQKKILIRKKEEDINTKAISSKLAVSSDIPVVQADLGSWEEQNNAWEGEDTEDLSWEAENIIREKRKAERQLRQQQQQRKKMERDQQKHSKAHTQGQLSAMKLS